MPMGGEIFEVRRRPTSAELVVLGVLAALTVFFGLLALYVGFVWLADYHVLARIVWAGVPLIVAGIGCYLVYVTAGHVFAADLVVRVDATGITLGPTSIADIAVALAWPDVTAVRIRGPRPSHPPDVSVAAAHRVGDDGHWHTRELHPVEHDAFQAAVLHWAPTVKIER